MDVSVTVGIKGEDNNNDENNVGTGYNNNNVKKARLHSMLAALLDDPILADVPKKPALSDVDTLFSLELGSAMRISVLKLDHTSIDVAVMNSATVKDLKLAIKKKVNDMEQSTMGHRHISCNEAGVEKPDYGMRNNSQVQFVPYVLSRASRKHSRRRKHRFFHGLNKRASRKHSRRRKHRFFHGLNKRA